MKKKRLIPVLLLRNGWLVQSKRFKRYQKIGNPINSVIRFSEWVSDELIYLDISQGNNYDMQRDDLGHPNRGSLEEIIDDVARVTFMPITFGGQIREIADIEMRLSRGADKISTNTAALTNPDFISNSARNFGSQCIVVSMDAKRTDSGYRIFANSGKEDTGWSALDWAKEVEQRGAGEILLNSIDQDGAKSGYDLELVHEIAEAVKIPVIALGGVGQWTHFAEALMQTSVDAVAAANVFQYSDQSVFLARKFLHDQGLNVRSPELFEFD